MRTLLIDNYDSFTYNLFQLISAVNGVEPTVLHNDAVHEVADLHLDNFDNIVISPGPGRPDRARDFGISADLIREATIPLLGVCLGHQGLAIGAGGTVSAAPAPQHGFLDKVHHDGRELFRGIPQQFTVVRYHSLCVDEPLPDALEVTARTADGVVMALRHRRKPQWGVQFHPESIATEFGEQLMRNFADLTAAPRSTPPCAPRSTQSSEPGPRRYRLQVEKLDRAVDTEAVFTRLYKSSGSAFWLDSEHVEPELDRFSFLGDAGGPLAEVISYDVDEAVVIIENSAGVRNRQHGTVFDYLAAQLRLRSIENPGLPFDFTCGYAGYFGYELKADTGSVTRYRSAIPDARWVFADRMIAVDHLDRATYLLALDDGTVDGPAGADAARSWLTTTRSVVDAVPEWVNPPELDRGIDHRAVETQLTRGHTQYLNDVDACKAQLRAGESYEICITDSVRMPATTSGLDFYRVLRRCNPAPYAAYLNLGNAEVACSSPERFLKIDRDRVVESKPIKGTAARGTTPAEDRLLRDGLTSSPKTRAENLMIVDLLRNDLGRVCEIGSVHVAKLMATETYSTVHQLVSTVRGRLRPEVDVIDCVRACFPGGSMTGAPKLRTMEIIDTIETQARGIYSGAIGFLGLAGTADLNVVIRTAVLIDGEWHIGAGGAIVLDSEPEDEYQEMVLKAAATARANS